MTKKYSSRFLLNPLEPSYFAKLAFFEDELYMLPSPTPYGYLMAENYSLWYIGGSGKDQSFRWLNHFSRESNPRKNIRQKKCWVSKKISQRHTKNKKSRKFCDKLWTCRPQKTAANNAKFNCLSKNSSLKSLRPIFTELWPNLCLHTSKKGLKIIFCPFWPPKKGIKYHLRPIMFKFPQLSPYWE